MPGFQDILGHETIKEHFKKAIAVHKVSMRISLREKREWGANPWPMHLL